MEHDPARFRLKRDVLYRRVWDEGVVLRKSSGEVLVLNDVGTRIVELCGTVTTVGDLVTRLVQEFDVEPEHLEADVLEFLQDLRDAGVIEHLEASAPELQP